jgi:hypothetical protein
MFTVEFLVLITLVLVWRLRRPTLAKTDFVSSPGSFLPLIVVGAIGLALSPLLLRVDRMPHGNWDGWAIWSAHARVLYFAGSRWADAMLPTNHPDYPLLVPAVIARFWRYFGTALPEIGGWIGVMFSLSAVAVLFAILSRLRNLFIASIMALALLGTPAYLDHSTSQYADVPLAFFILATVGLICLQTNEEPNDHRLLILAGFMAGCAGWTKNEGLLFVLAISMAMLTMGFRSRKWRRSLAFSAGLLIPLTVIIFFKFSIAEQNDLIRNQTYQDALQRLFDLNRYRTIFVSFLQTSWGFGNWTMRPMVPLLALVALRGVDRGGLRSYGWTTGAIALGIVLAGYCFVYVNTPVELQLHLDSSLNRLMLHLWPTFLLLIGLATRDGEVYPANLPS